MPPPIMKKQQAASLESIQQSIETELIQTVCHRARLVLVILPGMAAAVAWWSGQALSQMINPLLVCVTALAGGWILPHKGLQQMELLLITAVVVSFRHALGQGCSACLVPCVYGLLPCMSAFLFRTTRAVLFTTGLVLTALSVLYAIDLTGHCPSDPIAPHEKGVIVADRLAPLCTLILGNCCLLIVIVRQSQNSVLQYAQAAQASQTLAQLRVDILSRITHELRTPLSGIYGSVELLLDDSTLSKSDREHAQTIQSCLTSIVGTIDTVLLAAHASKLKPRKSTFTLSQVLDTVLESFVSSAEAKGIELRLDYQTANVNTVVWGLHTQLVQVLTNLVRNALAFTKDGHVTVKVAVEPSRNRKNSVFCHFCVSDTGCGIDTSEQAWLFEPFHQSESNAVSRRHQGVGLGLTVCRQFVESMGGTIVVSSARGVGSTFSFDLTLQTVDESRRQIGDKKDEKKEEDVADAQTGGDLIVLDSQPESLHTCLSIVETIVPCSASVQTFDSQMDVMEYAKTRTKGSSSSLQHDGYRIAVLECAEANQEFRNMVKVLNGHGWFVVLYGNEAVCFQLEKLADTGLCVVVRRPLSVSCFSATILDAMTPSQSLFAVPPELKRGDTSTTVSNASFMSLVPTEISVLQRLEPESTPASASSRASLLSPTTTSEAPRNPTSRAKSLPPPTKPSVDKIQLPPNSQIVIVDDTPVNVKVLTRLVSRLVSAPIVSLYSGEAAIDFVENNHDTDGPLFLFMDWHMPSVCGLTAANGIRKLSGQNCRSVYITMVTADPEGIYGEMEQRHILHNGTVARGTLTRRDEETLASSLTSHSDDTETLPVDDNDDGFAIDLVAGKPVTMQSVLTIMTYCIEQYTGSKPQHGE